MTLFHTCCETLHRSGGRRMEVNERRTVVGGVDWPLCVPPQPWREIDAHGLTPAVPIGAGYRAFCQHMSTGCPKKMAPFLYPLTFPNINRFSKLFHCQNQEELCKYPTKPQVCRYTTLWNVSVLKATIENKTTSVATHLKKLTTGNNLFIVSVIVWSKFK